MNLKIKKLHPDAILPVYASEGAACFDLHALNEGYLEDVSHPNGIFRTGLSFEIPAGWVMKIYSRSGHGFKHCVRLANSVGVIDSDYRGEVLVKLTVDCEGSLMVKSGDRIAQAMLEPAPQVTFELVDELSVSERGTGGFGSTGK